ncbi:MAG TPA: TetR/AcrR family transcriptional regulator [Natronosporangium sp.]
MAISSTPGLDRRRQRRRETIEEILRIAIEVMAEEGVAALSLSEVARRLGIRPPSLYKYFPSRLAVYDELFRRGWEGVLAAFRSGAAAAAPGLPALTAGVVAIGRYGMANQVLTQLISWRPVPGFQPTADAFAPSQEFVAELSRVVGTAVELGQLDPRAASEEGLAVLSTLIAGVMTQQLANEPHAPFDGGRFTRLFPIVLTMFARTYTNQEGQS